MRRIMKKLIPSILSVLLVANSFAGLVTAEQTTPLADASDVLMSEESSVADTFAEDVVEEGVETAVAADAEFRSITGHGTSADPFVIENGGDLIDFARSWNDETVRDYTKGIVHVKLVANIDVAYNPLFEPIGENGQRTAFNGHFDGNGFTIKGVPASLFGYVADATITNFKLDGMATDPTTLANPVEGLGALAYTASGSVISKIDAEVSVAGDNSTPYVGGLIGVATGTTIENCTISDPYASVSNVGIAGGLVGKMGGGVIRLSSFNAPMGTIESTAGIAGGLVGTADTGAVITQSFAHVTAEVGFGITAISSVGGIVGTANDTKISSSYSKGNVIFAMADPSGVEGAGGIVGVASNYTEINSVYTTSNLWDGGAAAGGVGGIAGHLDTTSKISNSVVLSEIMEVDALIAANFGVNPVVDNFGRIAGGAIGATTNNYAWSGIKGIPGGPVITGTGLVGAVPPYNPEFLLPHGGGQINGKDGRSTRIVQGSGSQIIIDVVKDKTLWTLAGFTTNSDWTVQNNPNTGALELPIIANMAGQSGDMPGHMKEELTIQNGYILISTIGDLLWFSENLGRYAIPGDLYYSATIKAKLVDDIDMALVNWGENTIITDSTSTPPVYLNEFDGNGHTLYNYTSFDAQLSPVMESGGLFHRLENCEVKNLSIEVYQADSSYSSVGVLANSARNAVVNNVRIFDNDEDVMINAYGTNGAYGGLFGDAIDTVITNSKIDLQRYNKHAVGEVFVGGMVGLAIRTTIKDSYAQVGEVAGTNTLGIGGLVGKAAGSTLENVYARTWVVSGEFNVGGLVGDLAEYHFDGTTDVSYGKSVVKNAYSLNNDEITGANAVGGLIGSTTGNGHEIDNVYATSPKVIASFNGTGNAAGGVIGRVISVASPVPQATSIKITKAVSLVREILVDGAASKIPAGAGLPIGGRVIGGVGDLAAGATAPSTAVLTDLFAWNGVRMGGTDYPAMPNEKPLALEALGSDDLRKDKEKIDGADLSFDNINDPLVWGNGVPMVVGRPVINFPAANWNIAANVLPTIKSSSSTLNNQWNQIPSYIYPAELKRASDGYYEISSIRDLYLFRDDINGDDGDTAIARYGKANIRVTTDLDFTLITDNVWTDPINIVDFRGYTDGQTNFTGIFDGNGHTIRIFEDGLFGYLTAATIKNVNLDLNPDPDISINPNNKLPSLVGIAEDGVTISNCTVKRDSLPVFLEHKGAGNIPIYGALVGELISSTVENSRVDIKETQSAEDLFFLGTVGGLVGKATRSDIIGSIANVVIDGRYMGVNPVPPVPGVAPSLESYVGGLVGEAIQSNIERCYTTGVVIATDTASNQVSSSYDMSLAGGLVGKMDDTTIKNSYSRVDVTASDAAGGLVGFVEGASRSMIDTTYATGNVLSNQYAGGIVGSIDGSRPEINNSVAMNNRIITTSANAEHVDRVLGNRDGNYNRVINNNAWDGLKVFYNTTIAKTSMTEDEKSGIGTNLKTLMTTVFWREAGFAENIWSDVDGDPYLPILELADDEESLFPWAMYLAYLGAEESQDIVIEGVPKVGNTLVATLRGQLVGKNVTYQWYLNSKAVSGATNHTFVIPSSAKVGDKITVIAALGNSKYAAKEVVVISEYEQVENFVTRLYDKVFNRVPDPQGFAFWVGQLTNKNVTATQMVDFFLTFSGEIEKMNLNNSDYLDILYAAIFDRDADKDPEGKAFWTYYLENGCSRRGIVLQFMAGPEFAAMCNDYKVVRGDIPAPGPIDVNLHRTAFIYRQYTKILGRPSDEEGLEFWAKEANNGMSVEDISRMLTDSDEFKSKNTTNTQYIEILYAAFFDRTPDATGMADWEKLMADGMSRKDVLEGFINSTEFQNLKTNLKV